MANLIELSRLPAWAGGTRARVAAAKRPVIWPAISLMCVIVMNHLLRDGLAQPTSDSLPSLPAHLPEARDFVRIERKRKILGCDVIGRYGKQRQDIGTLLDQRERLGVDLLAHV